MCPRCKVIIIRNKHIDISSFNTRFKTDSLAWNLRKHRKLYFIGIRTLNPNFWMVDERWLCSKNKKWLKLMTCTYIYCKTIFHGFLESWWNCASMWISKILSVNISLILNLMLMVNATRAAKIIFGPQDIRKLSPLIQLSK